MRWDRAPHEETQASTLTVSQRYFKPNLLFTISWSNATHCLEHS
jgi:hypothetical protein